MYNAWERCERSVFGFVRLPIVDLDPDVLWLNGVFVSSGIGFRTPLHYDSLVMHHRKNLHTANSLHIHLSNYRISRRVEAVKTNLPLFIQQPH